GLPARKRVAAYARVSGGRDESLHSLSAQVSYYSDYIQRRSDWEYAGVYTDQAITGTKDGRTEFQRLLENCRAGRVDVVLTKSISRFARNTLDLLETVRDLRGLGVDVHFERENIRTMDGEGELLLTILASFAQEESRSASENVKWRIRKGFQKGELVNLRFIFGYEIKNEKVEINPEEAAIVRMIFDDYISGMGGSLIARKLRGMNVPTVFDVGWDRRRVIDVIRNEKYVGNALLQKKYVTDHLSKARVRNKGELPMYYAKGTHPPIIDADTFDRAQAVLEKRRKLYAPKVVGRKRYPFSGIIYCGNCGRKYKRKTGNRRPAWQCSTYLEQGKAACQAKQIPEATLRKVAAEVLELDSFDKEAFAKNIEEIRVPGFNRLVFVFKDGREVKASWQDRSRAESWTEEMRQEARKRQLAIMEGGQGN
ncbi:MAG TPA: recombinase family protein, partial [Firmicutes bacterium]|nr:recombinase family protein [Bacillota bacterium]